MPATLETLPPYIRVDLMRFGPDHHEVLDAHKGVLVVGWRDMQTVDLWALTGSIDLADLHAIGAKLQEVGVKVENHERVRRGGKVQEKTRRKAPLTDGRNGPAPSSKPKPSPPPPPKRVDR